MSKPSLPTLWRRTVLLTGLGLMTNFVVSLLAGRAIRIPGVLQRIALSSFVNAVQPFYPWLFPFVGIAVWCFVSVVFCDPRCSPRGNGTNNWFIPPEYSAQSRIDAFVFGRKHMFKPEYDPEGLLSTLTTCSVTVCAGIVTCV